ncbi:hypothetical protein E2562_034069 [Oryza meyeriana var. granulata]|uniref:Myb-like domain-containing protein n=1 Tax=Oryza meyeriana var. granulata TaxID=110450 RepID=A0A6G1DRY2_9ORYZ|nr:hypothetical protein E2562_020210 [Oryza meyeriana var. granulata]KAF0915151.1 hypothetical protein E2562_034069 [Oryza meyeriana var. granulata]
MNPLRPPSSSSRRGRGAPAAHAARSDSVPGVPVARAPTAPADGSTTAAGNPASLVGAAAASPPPLPSLQAFGLPTWWTCSSPMGSSEGRPVESNAKDKETIVVDADETNEDERTERRLNWTKDEDVRLASTWLRHSKDPVDGTDRHGDQYWTDVTKEYNEGTEVCRRRNRNQLKIRWDRIKKPVMEFHGCWVSTTRVYRSGFSDDQLMDMAEKMYAKDHSDKDFTLKHFWKVVRNERKWSAYVKREKEKENKGASHSPVEVVNLEDNPNIRPMGHKKAKDELHGKKKIPQAYSTISDKVDKFLEVSTLARKDRDKMAETQQIMAHSKVEAARLNDKAAEKQLKCKMLDTYRELLLAPTTNMNAQALAERDKALESMRLALFVTDN